MDLAWYSHKIMFCCFVVPLRLFMLLDFKRWFWTFVSSVDVYLFKSVNNQYVFWFCPHSFSLTLIDALDTLLVRFRVDSLKPPTVHTLKLCSCLRWQQIVGRNRPLCVSSTLQQKTHIHVFSSEGFRKSHRVSASGFHPPGHRGLWHWCQCIRFWNQHQRSVWTFQKEESKQNPGLCVCSAKAVLFQQVKKEKKSECPLAEGTPDSPLWGSDNAVPQFFVYTTLKAKNTKGMLIEHN